MNGASQTLLGSKLTSLATYCFVEAVEFILRVASLDKDRSDRIHVTKQGFLHNISELQLQRPIDSGPWSEGNPCLLRRYFSKAAGTLEIQRHAACETFNSSLMEGILKDGEETVERRNVCGHMVV